MQQGHPLLHMPAVSFQDEMLFCDSCDRGFHMECCDPPLSRMPKGEVFTLSGFSVSRSAVNSKPFSSQTAVWGCHSAHSEAAVAYQELCMHIKLFQHPRGDLLSLDYSTDPTARLVMMVHVLQQDIWQAIHTSHIALFNKLTRSLSLWTEN